MKFGVLVLSLFVALVASTNATDQKIFNEEPQKPSLKIIDGTVAKPGEVPYQAGLISHIKDGTELCGGSLLTENRVVTAAHCWWDGVTQVIKFTVVLGSVTLPKGGVRIDTSKVVMHEKWNPRTMRNDIAIVYLPQKVKFTKNIQPITLPSGSMLQNNFVGYMALASGYGDTRDGNKQASLYYAELKVITNQQCSLTHGDVPPTEICTSSHDYKNICDGDSGGPLAIFTDNRYVLIGITSYGEDDCTTKKPSGYTRVTAYVDWIKKHL